MLPQLCVWVYYPVLILWCILCHFLLCYHLLLREEMVAFLYFCFSMCAYMYGIGPEGLRVCVLLVCLCSNVFP